MSICTTTGAICNEQCNVYKLQIHFVMLLVVLPAASEGTLEKGD